MLQEFEEHLAKNLAYLKKNRALIAVSGGLDSVVLTHLCHTMKMDFALAHCNFNLRGEESDLDEQFVIDLADTLELEVFVQNFETEDFAKTNKLSTQMAARKLRYDWFQELAGQLNFDYILTAHHADDNLETFLINLSRGTGLDGLTGIPEQNGNIIRPLLVFSKAEIELYAQEHNLKWREDTSNASDKYLRNAMRHHVIPKLKELNPTMLQNFEKTTSHLKGLQQIVQDCVQSVEQDIVSKDANGEVHFNVSKLQKLSDPKAYLFQLLKNYGFTEWNDVSSLPDAQTGKQILSSTHRLIKNRNELILKQLKQNKQDSSLISEGQDRALLPDTSKIFFEEATSLFDAHTDVKNGHDRFANVIYVDKDLLNFPLTVRGWQEGDYFYPFGMKGKKKLSKFFKDEKLSLFDKEKIHLLCSEDQIIWVMGMRADERFKVSKKTKNILKITLEE